MTRIGTLGRRQFLRGAGGFALAVPVLPSLLSRRAQAQAHQQKRFIAIATTHGGVPQASMFPGDGAADAAHELFAGHFAHHGALPRTVSGANASISPTLTAPADQLTERLVGKMNVIRGLGIVQWIAHHSGGHLGNIGRKDGGTAIPQNPTVDQCLAWSNSFYPDLTSVVQRSVHVDSKRDPGRGLSWGWSDPANGRGNVTAIPVERNSLQLYDRLFENVTADPVETRRPVVDRVLDHYRGMTRGRFGDASRLSAADRTRLEEHMQRMYELQRRLETRGVVSCGTARRPTRAAGFGEGALELTRSPVDEAVNAEWFQLYIDVLVAAIMCNITSIATIYPRSPFLDGWPGTDWHERVAHAGDGERLGAHVTSVFRNVFLDLAAKLDVEELDGRTYLDNSLIQLTQESGMVTHFSIEMPLVTAGSAGGWFRTGRFVDYRYRESTLLPKSSWSDARALFRQGLTWNQWLANVLMAMGLPESEWADGSSPGYGDLNVSSDRAEAYHQGIVNAASDTLPLLKA